MGFWKSKKVAAGGSGGDTKVAEAKNGGNGAFKEGEAGDTKKKKLGCCDRLTKTKAPTGTYRLYIGTPLNIPPFCQFPCGAFSR